MHEHLMIGAITILAGLALRFFPAKKRNAIYGYRSRRSFHSQESWDFAQRYSGGWAIVLGIVSTGIGAITYLLGTPRWIPVFIGILLLIAVIPITEERLRKKRFR
jgi:uncharacterized membrane protein